LFDFDVLELSYARNVDDPLRPKEAKERASVTERLVEVRYVCTGCGMSRFRATSWQASKTVVLLQHSRDFYTAPHCRADCLVAYQHMPTNWGRVMAISFAIE
jgi:hypothetical protein